MWQQLDEIDAEDLPTGESDVLEYKSGKLSMSGLENKLQAAASGFWNAGGGFFLAGVSDSGEPEEGVPRKVGRQPLEDWVDRALARVSPQATWGSRLLAHPGIDNDRCVLAVHFSGSSYPPHQAPDGRYYVRVGRHTLPAPHYLVEALFTRRNHHVPRVVHYFRRKPAYSRVVQLVVETAGPGRAYNARISLSNVPKLWADIPTPPRFPLVLPVLSADSPFVLDMSLYGNSNERMGDDISLEVVYDDETGQSHSYVALLDPAASLPPWGLGAHSELERIYDLHEKGIKTMGHVADLIEGFLYRASSGEK